MHQADIEILDNSKALQVTWPDGDRHRYHGIWLRDNGQDTLTRDPGNGQKKFSIADISLDCEIHHAAVEDKKISLKFSDGASTHIDLGWLRKHHYDLPQQPSLTAKGISTWGSELTLDTHSDTWENVCSAPEALLNWLRHIDRSGFAHLSGTPRQQGTIFSVVDLFGYIRETNYGRLFEVRSEEKPVNLAYTSIGLDPHTDNPYRDPVPTLQLLHCIENDTKGGESIVVDGFRAAEVLHQENPRYFNLLSQHNASFQYDGDGSSSLQSKYPMIEMSTDGKIRGVRINNRSCGAITDVPYDLMPEYYAAYAALAEITRRDALQVRFLLEPGGLFVVDNTRVLHGRDGFTTTGSRWFQGAYADKDALQSTIRRLEKSIHD